MTRAVRLAYLVSHPIQYQAPLLRRLALEPDIELTVLFGSDFSARGYADKGFGVEVAWDVPLMEGYRSRVLPVLRDNGTVTATTPMSRALLPALCDRSGDAAYDVLWTHGYATVNALRGIFAARLLDIPVLLRAESWEGDRPRSVIKQLSKKLFFRALRPMITATLPIGSRNENYWRTALGADVPQFPVPYAVDNAFFRRKTEAAAPQAQALRAELGLAPGRPVVLFASKLQTRKHADHLVQAMARLGSTPTGSPYLIIVGDGEERQSLAQQCRDLQLNSVRFAGFRNQTELPAFFSLSDVFVLPSRHEPWGLIVNEAMAAGLPVVVSSDVGAAPDLVREGVTGSIYPVGDVDALMAALARVLASPEGARRMGAKAAERMQSWDFEADVRGLRQAIAFATGKLRA